MTSRRLLNADALFALVLGLVLLLNGLLGPRFPFGAPLAALVGVVLLIAAIVLGQGGMGKGPLTGRVRDLGRLHLIISAAVGVGAVLGLDGAARNFAVVVAAIIAAIGSAQLARGGTEGTVAHAGHPRASAFELRAAIGRTEPASTSESVSVSESESESP